jgi:putative lipoprotein
MYRTIGLALTAVVLGACNAVPPPVARLEGEVFYLQRSALPPSATLSVALQDISRVDSPAFTLARESGPVKGQVPLPFRLEYDPRQIQSGHRYAVSARIEADGKLLFINAGQATVRLDGSDPRPLRIRLNPARLRP